MASLRRTVEGWMGDALYNKLGEQPSVEVAWKLMRDLVGQQLFGTEFVPVPFIESASYFNQLFVFVKKQSILSTLGLRPPTYKIVGNLDYLVNRDESTWSPQFDFSPWDVADGHSMYREYRLRIMSNQIGVEKTIEFNVIESHIRGAQAPTPGAVRIYRNILHELSTVSRLYVITDVILASYVRISVTIGSEHTVFVHDRDMPIAFRYRKYKLRNNGELRAEVNTVLRIQERKAIWERPLPQPIPNIPMWDYMRRRYHNGRRRKLRHNLTIPTQGEIPDEISRRMRQEGGFLRFERPVVNEAVRATDVIHVDEDEAEVEWPNQMFQRVIPDPENRRNAIRAVSMETLRGSD